MIILRHILLIFGYLGLGAAVISLLISGISALQTHFFLKTAQTAEATVTKLTEYKSKGGGKVYAPSYSFIIPETNQLIEVTSNTRTYPAVAQPGEKLQVMFAKDNPKNVSPSNPRFLWLLSSITLTVGIVWLFISTVSLLIAHKFLGKYRTRQLS